MAIPSTFVLTNLGSTYVKAFFREFTGEDFLTIKEPKSADAHKGLLGA